VQPLFLDVDDDVRVPRQNSIPAGDRVGSPDEHRRSKPRIEWEVLRQRTLVARSSKLRTGETQYIEEGAGVRSQSQGHQLRQPGRIDDAARRVYREI